jgi:hypothetical protein
MGSRRSLRYSTTLFCLSNPSRHATLSWSASSPSSYRRSGNSGLSSPGFPEYPKTVHLQVGGWNKSEAAGRGQLAARCLKKGVIPIPPVRNAAGFAEFLWSVKEPVGASIFTGGPSGTLFVRHNGYKVSATRQNACETENRCGGHSVIASLALTPERLCP